LKKEKKAKTYLILAALPEVSTSKKKKGIKIKLEAERRS
jgi:hypothetical protein